MFASAFHACYRRRLRRVLASSVVFGSVLTSVGAGVDLAIPSSFIQFGGVIEQIHVYRSDHEYVCEDRVINPKTGDGELRQSHLADTGAVSMDSIFQRPQLFENLEI